MNDRPDITGTHISFEIDPSPSRQPQTGQTWIEMPKLPNASETAPHGIGFHPVSNPFDARLNSTEPSARYGFGQPSAMPSASKPQVISSIPISEVRPPSRPEHVERSPRRRTEHSKPQARTQRSTSPIPALKPPDPGTPSPKQRFDPMPVLTPLAQGHVSPVERAALADIPDLLRQQNQVPSPSKAKSSKPLHRGRRSRSPKPPFWATTKQATQRVAKSVARRVPSPSTIAHEAVQMGQAARQSWRKTWGVPALWLGILTLSSGMGAIAFLTLAHQPPAPDCQQLSALSPDIDTLYCAQQAAQSGKVEDLVAGVDLVRGWTEEHPLYREGQDLLTRWSKDLLAIAREKFEQSDLHGATNVANHIPRNSSMYADAQEAITDWQGEWQNGESIYEAVEDAIKSREWKLANEKLLELGRLRHSFWRQQQADYLAQRIVEEKEAWQIVDRARKLAATNKLADIGKAIALVRTLSPKTFVWETAQADQDRWSQALLTVGMKHWQQGNVNVAIDLIRQIPISTDAFPEATDLILYSHAQYWAKSAQNQAWMPSLQEIWNLNAAIAAAKQIDSQSPLYVEAQAQAQAWQAQLNDVLDLKLADWLADMGDRSTYELAIEQAEQVESDRPRRVQAQTLVAHWNLEIERLEDRPILDRAYRMAGRHTIPMLEAAIAEASQVQPGRALRVEAQTSIAHWKLEIERIEDQPLLDEAIALADQGRLSEAIRAAKRIPSDRALHTEAQSLANTWQTTIESTAIAADRDILDQAYGYATREWYSVAIDVASQIAPDRPLYDEAQAAIANWKDARAAFRQYRDQAPIERESDGEDDSSSSYEGYYNPY